MELTYSNDDLRSAEAAVVEARAAYNGAGLNVRLARAEHAKRLLEWTSGIVRPTASQIAQAFRDAAMADRQARSQAGRYRPPPTITQTARYRNQAKGAGGGTSFVRGSRDFIGKPIPKTQALELEALRIRAARAAAAAGAK